MIVWQLSLFFLECLGRWYIREGWLLVVPSKGEELKRRMFFLFSDIFISTKPCHPLHLLNSNKFACTAVYPLHQCVVDKVFGHTRSEGGLLSVSLPASTWQKYQWVRLQIKFLCLSSSTAEVVSGDNGKCKELVCVRAALLFWAGCLFPFIVGPAEHWNTGSCLFHIGQLRRIWSHWHALNWAHACVMSSTALMTSNMQHYSDCGISSERTL